MTSTSPTPSASTTPQQPPQPQPQSQPQSQPQYTHGHHKSVLASHSWRTAANSAGYILPLLKPTDRVLDLGCGPGTITVDLAAHVPQGHVVGLDTSESLRDQAATLARDRGVANVEFVVGDAYALPYADAEFDVVLCHQVLQHVHDPVGVLREMRRVCKRGGGIVAARESDYAGMLWYPETKGLEEWRAVYASVARGNGGEPNAGRMLHVWTRQAGFGVEEVKCSVSCWCYATKEEVKWWSGTWAERTAGEGSALARTAVEKGVATREGLDALAAAWREWGDGEDAWFMVPSGEIICRNV